MRNLIEKAMKDNKTLNENDIKKYFKIYNETKSSEVRDIIFNGNIKLIGYCCKDYLNNKSYDNEDLMQIASIGLLKAIDTFDLNVQTKWSTYACTCIINEIRKFTRRFNAVKRNKYVEISTSATINTNDANDITIEDMLRDETVNIEDQILLKLSQDDIKHKLNNIDIKSILSDLQYEVMCYKFGLNNRPMLNGREINEVMNNKANISRVVSQSINKLRKVIK